ncbi:hypothetical protein [Amycolatopsis benzoatilytica]|uniref:hypothetical protein n=1 Tax=Amycolatopsis benzoatilytica TaxID=346045 RepID=UPI0003A9ED54|nr:hypothetical protein [Amycolatopsis benzoatilytica]
MTQRSQSPDGRSGRLPDSTRPPRTRRGGDRAPYPGASTRATGAGARPPRATTRPEGATAPANRRATTAPTTPIPATVWTCGDRPVDAHAPWPAPIVETITAAFTAPGAHVVLVDVDIDTEGATPTRDASAVAAAREAVRTLDRTAETHTLDPRAHGPAPSSRPFWADLVTDSAGQSADLAGAPSLPPRTGALDSPDPLESDNGARADLVLVSLPAHAAETVSLDRLALLAAQRLRHGGIFAVYTHSDWTRGRLVDPTGAIVAACQHADLLYLQHIVALHTPAENGRLRAAPSATAAAEYDRTRHRATVRGLPAPHLRAHGDVLAFAQPADPAAPATDTGPATASPGTGGDR